MDPDFHVLKLNKDLVAMEDVMTHNLQPRKFKSVLRGQRVYKGHLGTGVTACKKGQREQKGQVIA